MPNPNGSDSRRPSKIDLNVSTEDLQRKRSDSPSQMSSDDQVGTPSTIASASSNGNGLGRITSRKSSTSSIPASATSASGQKRILPVFNLSVHNVMHSTVVTDAGTDARVAKVSFRGTA